MGSSESFRTRFYWSIPFIVVAAGWVWNHIQDASRARELSRREVWMSGVQAYILVDDADRFTMRNFQEFMQANPELVLPDEFTRIEEVTPHPVLPIDQIPAGLIPAELE